MQVHKKWNASSEIILTLLLITAYIVIHEGLFLQDTERTREFLWHRAKMIKQFCILDNTYMSPSV